MRAKIIIALLLVVLIGAVSIYYAFKPIKEEGVVAAKAITGTREKAVYTIIRFHETGVNPKIDDWESLFPNTTKVSEYAESQLKTIYTDLRYVVNIRRKPKTMGYYASKDDFNKVNPGDAVTFKILRTGDPTVKIMEIASRETDEATPVEGGSENPLTKAILSRIPLIAGFSGLLLFCYRVLSVLLPSRALVSFKR